MASHVASIRQLLARGPLESSALQERLSLSQATVSRALSAMGGELLRLSAGRSVIYSLTDSSSGLPDLRIYRVDANGRLHDLGLLIPVQPAGFVMRQTDGQTLRSDGLPWWLADMRPQGFLGLAFASRHAAALGLPASVAGWSDRHVLRALTAFGHDHVGNLLVGNTARDRFLAAEPPTVIVHAERPLAYARLATQASRGDEAGSSAGGEQPKFTAYAETAQGPAPGPAHVLVKFSHADPNPVSARWRDLLFAEHLALQVLREAGMPAARSAIVDHGPQRFLELERFDRVGERGRRALHSLGSLDDEFVGDRTAPWPVAVGRLIDQGVVQPQSRAGAALLYAFGVLAGNTDMHMGNLSFISEHGQPCQLAPAYDMLPMAFAPNSSGALRSELPPLRLPACVPLLNWHPALQLARGFMTRLRAAVNGGDVSPAFQPCVEALAVRLTQAAQQVDRIAS